MGRRPGDRRTSTAGGSLCCRATTGTSPSTYPELRLLGEALGLDAGGPRRRDRRLRRGRSAELRPAAAAARSDRSGAEPGGSRPAIPVVYILFDLLHLDGRSTLDLPYTAAPRAAGGARAVRARPGRPRRPSRVPAGTCSTATKEQGLEGRLAKRRRQHLPAGPAHADWLKVKNVRDQEVVIGGWTPGRGPPQRHARRAAPRRARGRTAYGTSARWARGSPTPCWSTCTKRLSGIERKTSPFIDVPRKDAKDARWCSPDARGRGRLQRWTTEGRLRHPSGAVCAPTSPEPALADASRGGRRGAPPGSRGGLRLSVLRQSSATRRTAPGTSSAGPWDASSTIVTSAPSGTPRW